MNTDKKLDQIIAAVTSLQQDMKAIAEQYIARYPDDAVKLALLRRQLDAGDDMNDRKNFTGHITGGAIVVSPDHRSVLLIHHKFLNMWIQPGGHWDPDESDPLTAARREAEEETAVRIAEYLSVDAEQPLLPLHIGSHHIPANPKKSEPEHYHHDFRYAFVAADQTLSHREQEVAEASWFGLDSPLAYGLGEVISRLKMLLDARQLKA